MITLVGGASLGDGDDGGSSCSGSSSTATLTIPTTAKVVVLLDSVVAGVSFETNISLRAYRLPQWALLPDRIYRQFSSWECRVRL